MADIPETVEADIRDVGSRLCRELDGRQPRQPADGASVRRRVMATDHVNPVPWGWRFAKQTRPGGLIGRRSIVAAPGEVRMSCRG